MNNAVTIVSVGAGLSYGPLGYTHHAIEDLAILRVLPNLRIYSPSCPSETIYSIKSILASKAPAYLRLGKGGERELHSENDDNLSSINILKKGSSGVICWTGAIGALALDALEALATQGIFPTLISIPFLSDESLQKVLKVADGAPILSLEEHVLPGGLGSWLLETANTEKYFGRIARMGIDIHNYSIIGSQEFLRTKSHISVLDLAAAFLELIGGSQSHRGLK